MVAGSDAHTLRRVGTTWTTAPGRSLDEFLASLRQGLGVPGGRDGTTATIAGEAYGVIAAYVAALAGFGPRDLPPRSPRGVSGVCRRVAAVSVHAASDRGEQQGRRASSDRATEDAISRTPPAWCRRRRRSERRSAGRRRAHEHPRRHHRRRSGHGAGRHPRGELAPDAGGRMRHLRRRPSSTPKATAAASPPRWTSTGSMKDRRRSNGGADRGATGSACAQRSRRSLMPGCSTAPSIARASACSLAPAPPICCATRIFTGRGLLPDCIAPVDRTPGITFPAHPWMLSLKSSASRVLAAASSPHALRARSRSVAASNRFAGAAPTLCWPAAPMPCRG